MNIRILYRRGMTIVCGPLGCFDMHKAYEVEGEKWVVTSIDPDGAGVMRKASDLRLECEESGKSPQEVLNQYRTVRTSYDWGHATPTAQAGILAQMERNRREHGLAA